MRLALALMSGLAITAAGCASIDTLKEGLATAKICCHGHHEFRYKDLPLTGELRLSIADDSPVFEFSSGRSYFDAVRLGGASRPTKVRIKIYHAPQSVYVRLGIFCPSVTFLTAQYEMIQTAYVLPQWRWGFWTSAFFFADYEIPASAVYAVIHSEGSRSGEHLTRVVASRTPEGFGFGSFAVALIQLLSSGRAFTATEHLPCAPIVAGGALMMTHDVSEVESAR